MPTISRILIEQQFASIGVNTTSAQLSINTPRPRMKLNHEIPKPQIDTERPSFKVNWQQVRAESGLKPPTTLALSIRDDAKGEIANYTQQAVQDGNTLGNVTQPGMRVAQVAKQHTQQNNHKDINLGLMPQNSPEITWEPGYVNISWEDRQLQMEWDKDYLPEVVLDPPFSIEIFLRNKPYIKITVEDGTMPGVSGQHVDAKL